MKIMPNLFIDTHVHIYPDYNVARLLDSALQNFKKFSENYSDSYFVLALTERFDCNFFKSSKEPSRHGKWELRFDSKTELICATNSEDKIFILPGRQNISSEKLEVLTLGSDDFRAERLPAVEIIKGATETGLVTILPWSFGKWIGRRGKLVKKLIQDSTLDFALGDPAHRFGLKPKLFKEGEISGRVRLCGTDPLPLSGDEERVASYGSIFEVEAEELNRDKILKALLSLPKTYGERLQFSSAVSLQLQLRGLIKS